MDSTSRREVQRGDARCAGRLEAGARAGHDPPMDTGTSPILRQVARTGLLAGSLGLLLYAALTVVAELRHARWLIGLVLSAPLAALLAFVVAQSLRTGTFPAMGGAVSRARQPVSYWCLNATYVACGLLLGVLAIWSAFELVVGNGQWFSSPTEGLL